MQLTRETMSTRAGGAPNTIVFGGLQGTFYPIQDIGGQMLIFKSSDFLNSIQIGSTVYGGSGGSETGRAKLPSNGQMRLTRLQAGYYKSDLFINYFEALIDNVHIQSGTLHESDYRYGTFTADLNVRLSGINAGSHIIGVQFDLIT